MSKRQKKKKVLLQTACKNICVDKRSIAPNTPYKEEREEKKTKNVFSILMIFVKRFQRRNLNIYFKKEHLMTDFSFGPRRN